MSSITNSYVNFEALKNPKARAPTLRHVNRLLGKRQLTADAVQFGLRDYTHLTDKFENTLLHMAAYGGLSHLIKPLSAHIDINQRDRNGETPFHSAVKGGGKFLKPWNLSTIRSLIACNAQLVLNRKQETPLDLATKLKYTACIKLLTSSGQNEALAHLAQANKHNLMQPQSWEAALWHYNQALEKADSTSFIDGEKEVVDRIGKQLTKDVLSQTNSNGTTLLGVAAYLGYDKLVLIFVDASSLDKSEGKRIKQIRGALISAYSGIISQDTPARRNAATALALAFMHDWNDCREEFLSKLPNHSHNLFLSQLTSNVISKWVKQPDYRSGRKVDLHFIHQCLAQAPDFARKIPLLGPKLFKMLIDGIGLFHASVEKIDSSTYGKNPTYASTWDSESDASKSNFYGTYRPMVEEIVAKRRKSLLKKVCSAIDREPFLRGNTMEYESIGVAKYRREFKRRNKVRLISIFGKNAPDWVIKQNGLCRDPTAWMFFGVHSYCQTHTLYGRGQQLWPACQSPERIFQSVLAQTPSKRAEYLDIRIRNLSELLWPVQNSARTSIIDDWDPYIIMNSDVYNQSPEWRVRLYRLILQHRVPIEGYDLKGIFTGHFLAETDEFLITELIKAQPESLVRGLQGGVPIFTATNKLMLFANLFSQSASAAQKTSFLKKTLFNLGNNKEILKEGQNYSIHGSHRAEADLLGQDLQHMLPNLKFLRQHGLDLSICWSKRRAQQTYNEILDLYSSTGVVTQWSYNLLYKIERWMKRCQLQENWSSPKVRANYGHLQQVRAFLMSLGHKPFYSEKVIK